MPYSGNRYFKRRTSNNSVDLEIYLLTRGSNRAAPEGRSGGQRMCIRKGATLSGGPSYGTRRCSYDRARSDSMAWSMSIIF